MAYLSERISNRVENIIEGEFINNAKFSYTIEERKSKTFDDDLEEKIVEVKYGRGKSFKIIYSKYAKFPTVKVRPVIISEMDEDTIDRHIARLHNLLK